MVELRLMANRHLLRRPRIEIHGTNYLIPVDTKLASGGDADDEAITRRSVDVAKKLRLIILDACRDNPFIRTTKVQRTASVRGSSSDRA
jgi:uncharacterized caspase-like protein